MLASMVSDKRLALSSCVKNVDSPQVVLALTGSYAEGPEQTTMKGSGRL
jgi:hypothetical protein